MSTAAERTLGKLPSFAMLIGLWSSSVGLALYLRHVNASPFWVLMGGAMAGAILIALLEYIVPRINWRPTWKEILQDVLHMGFLTFIVRPAARGAFVATVFAGVERLNERGFLPNRPDISSAPLVLQILFMLFMIDLFFYTAHRILHAVGALWRCHAIHHSATAFYWLRSMRIHGLEACFTTCMNLIAVSLVKVSPVALLVAFIIINVLITLQHSNVTMNLGWLSYIIATPEFHRVHHSVNITEERSNYAGMFALLDLLFGTYHVVVKTQIGLASEEKTPVTFLDDLVFPFRRGRMPQPAPAPVAEPKP